MREVRIPYVPTACDVYQLDMVVNDDGSYIESVNGKLKRSIFHIA